RSVEQRDARLERRIHHRAAAGQILGAAAVPPQVVAAQPHDRDHQPGLAQRSVAHDQTLAMRTIYAASTRTSYFAKCRSAVTTVSCSDSACAMSMRSKGSSW